MTYVAKPKLHHPTLPKNKIGYTRRDCEGKVSTLCAGCGHDSISAALIQAFWELDIQPHRVAKLSASAAAPRRPTISSATATASTPCTAACPRSSPARTSPTAT
jgi:2-oxoglutarate ferredoxin oxidoreductase subunit beta